MGSFAKALGRISRRSLETESANILKTCKANKVPGSLSLALDGTLRSGHDMKTFGLGTMAAMAGVPRYARFTHAMFHVYAAMEHELDSSTAAAPPTAAAKMWREHGAVLRRADKLRADIDDVLPLLRGAKQNGAAEGSMSLARGCTSALVQLGADAPPSPATEAYVEAVAAAGAHDRESGGARLLGHLYCRYFADLFGGQMLELPFNVALGLVPGTPRHYGFDFSGGGRREFIEKLYADINEAGALLSEAECAAVVDEALLAFAHNAAVYAEEPMTVDAARGVANLLVGGARRVFTSA